MPIPRLIHPVTILLRKFESEETAIMDDNLREPVGQVQRAQVPIELKAQHMSGNFDKPLAGQGSVVEESDGYFLFLTRDLNAKKVVIERGDLIIQIGTGDFKHEVQFYITGLKLRGHYPGQDGPTLIQANYEDRHPSRK